MVAAVVYPSRPLASQGFEVRLDQCVLLLPLCIVPAASDTKRSEGTQIEAAYMCLLVEQ